MLNPALVGTVQPSLEKRCGHVDTGQDFVRQFCAAADNGNLMLVSSLRQTRIAAPSIGVDHRADCHGVLNEGNEAVPGHVHDASEANAANTASALLGCHRDDRLGFRFTPPHALFRTADVGLIYLDNSGQAIPARPDHSPAQLVEPSPGCLIATKTKNSLKSQCAHPILLAGNEPHRKKPLP